MRSLENLGANLPVSLLSIGFLGGGPADSTSRRHFTHFIRLVDLAVAEYEVSRRHYEFSQTDLSDRRVDAAFHAISHLELSVITARRALAALHAISRDRGSPEIPRQERRRIQSLEEQTKDVRDFIIHAEEKISAEELRKGESHALRIRDGGDVAEIGPYRFPLDGFARLLEKLHEIAGGLARFKESLSETPS